MSASPLAKLVGDKTALANALGDIEKAFASAAIPEILKEAYAAPAAAHVVGFTGPPGVGKSTLIGALIPELRRGKRRVAIVAVDPSSPLSRGSILGDRLRLNLDPADPDLFARSVAAGDARGGVARPVMPFVCLLRCLFDVVIVESIGIGQAEGEILHLVDTMVLCLQPAAGDVIQYMKAGVLELPHIFCVNKADLPHAAATKNALTAASAAIAEPPAILSASAIANEGVGELITALDGRFAALRAENQLVANRKRGEKHWLEAMVKEKFGSHGSRTHAAALASLGDENPFVLWARIAQTGQAARR